MTSFLHKHSVQRLMIVAISALAGLCAVNAYGEEDPVTEVRAVDFSWGSKTDLQAFDLEFSRETDTGYQVIPDGLKSVKVPAFAGKLPPGDYQVRIRAVDQRGVPGPWGAPIDLVVPFSPVELVAPTADKKLTGSSSSASPVTFSWKPVKGAPGYQIKVTDEIQHKVVLDKTLSEPKLTTDLAVAKDYSWEVRVSDDDDQLGDKGSARAFTLLGARLGTPDLEVETTKDQRVITWPKIEFATTYSVKLMYRKGKKGPWKQLAKVDSSLASFSVPPASVPGTYRFTAVAKADRRVSSQLASVKFDILTKEQKEAAALQSITRYYRLNAAYTPVYWRHAISSDDNSGVAFNILMFEAYSLNLEAWFLDDKLSTELVYGRWSTVLFGNTLPGTGVQADQKPLKINGQDLALKGKYNFRLFPFMDFGITGGVRRSTAFFFYKDTPSTIALFDSSATYLTVGSSLTLQLWQKGELRGWAETDYPLNGQGFKIKKATDYRLNGNLTSFVMGRSLAFLFLYQYDYRHWLYELNGLGISGHVVDSSHTFGVGLESQF